MGNDIDIKIEEGKKIDLTRVHLENGVCFSIFQHPCGSTSINVHRMTKNTAVTIMGRKVTKKLSSLGNTNLKVVE